LALCLALVLFCLFGSSTEAAVDPVAPNPAAFQPPAVTVPPQSLPQGSVGVSYDGALAATGGTAPYHWSITIGSLPPGLTLDPGSGAITGTPSARGSFKFEAQATDSAQPAGSAVRGLFITVTVPPLSIPPTTLAGGTVGSSYSATLTAAGGTSPYSWSMEGDLPPGLTLNPASGAITGTPSRAGTFRFLVVVTDSTKGDAQSARRELSIAVVLPPLSITTASLLRGTVGGSYHATLAATGGTPPYRWSLSQGALAPGLRLSADSGAITGTPSRAGTFAFVAQVSDASRPESRSTTKALSITVILASVDGVGTMAVTPTSVSTSAKGPLTFVYTAGRGGLDAGGAVALTVPQGWTQPSTTPGNPGDVSVRPSGSVSVTAGRQIVVTGVALGDGQTLTITYGGTAPIAPGSPGSFTFPSAERFDATGTLTALTAGSPTESVTNSTSPVLVVVLVLIVVVLLAAALVVIRRIRARRAAAVASRVRAFAHTGPPSSVVVDNLDGRPTVAVRVEPHPSEAATTVEVVQHDAPE
jgi:hypothetical protein